EGHHIPDVARDSLEVEGEITLFQLNGQLDTFVRHVEQYLVQFRPVKPPALANIPRLKTHCERISECFKELAAITQALLPERGEAEEYLF
ncbi:ATP-dependent DNA helicase DinG, partial [Xenorhabdus bovienii]|nr:ATP-dependent DNA helicase DinG [Xenorhabdus bovienii]